MQWNEETYTYNKTNFKHKNGAAVFSFSICHWSAFAHLPSCPKKKGINPNSEISDSEEKRGSQTSLVHFWRGASWSVRISKVNLVCVCHDSFGSSCGMVEARVQERSQIRAGTTKAWTSCLTDSLCITREKCHMLLRNLDLFHFLHPHNQVWKMKIKVAGNWTHFNSTEHLKLTHYNWNLISPCIHSHFSPQFALQALLFIAAER